MTVRFFALYRCICVIIYPRLTFTIPLFFVLATPRYSYYQPSYRTIGRKTQKFHSNATAVVSLFVNLSRDLLKNYFFSIQRDFLHTLLPYQFGYICFRLTASCFYFHQTIGLE